MATNGNLNRAEMGLQVAKMLRDLVRFCCQYDGDTPRSPPRQD
ncbi:hypothetical protein TR2A62_0043 [Thalassobium sp. R2A62]|jgi:hypothetical protein|nr:hypothetical protein TR2A62_0043 [Thalassobium sp. R2A62]